MNQKQVIAEVSTLLSDILGQVSTDRLNSAVKSAWKDGYVSTQAYDNSLVFDSSVYEYTLPETISVVDSIYVKQSSASNPTPISADLWEVINGVIHFNNDAIRYLETGNQLHIRGKYKLTASDLLPNENPTLQEYVVALASWIVLKQIGFTKILSFLRNDTSMSELIQFRREIERDVKAYRTQLQTSYMDN